MECLSLCTICYMLVPWCMVQESSLKDCMLTPTCKFYKKLSSPRQKGWNQLIGNRWTKYKGNLYQVCNYPKIMKSWCALANRFETIFWTDRLTDGQKKNFLTSVHLWDDCCWRNSHGLVSSSWWSCASTCYSCAQTPPTRGEGLTKSRGCRSAGAL